MSTASEKANLARIRDNQRRSRARRKEYLQELESRLRSCELQGIEASSEIQVAARRVAEENKKLRMLLAQSGVGEDVVKAFLATDQQVGNSMGYSNVTTSQPVEVLETLLNKRKQCCADGSTTSGLNSNTFSASQRGGSRDSSVGSISTVQSSVWEPIQPRRTIEKSATGHGQFITPNSRGSSISYGRDMHRIHGMPTTLSPSTSGIPILSRDLQPQHAHPESQHQSQSQSQSHQHLHQHQHQNQNPNQSIFDFGESLHFSDGEYPPPTQQRNIQQQQPQQQQQQQSQHGYPPISNDTNSCLYATDMITTMAGGNPEDIRTDLGCLSSMDCQVDNQLVFNVMDRYSGPDMGL